MTDAEYHLTAERDELRRQVEGLRKERERWRRLPTPLTDAERETICYVAGTLDHLPWYQRKLRGLLERTAKWDTTGPRNGAVDTPPTHATPGDCSTPSEGT